MPELSPQPIPSSGAEPKLKIYFLPNLLTAGNLFCGFVALTKIVEADVNRSDFQYQITLALGFILLACIFDLFDGRVARMGGIESPFGREFDSLADLISFGAAPAFLVHRVVLNGVFTTHPEWGWFIASIYLLCGAFRLARFNCLAVMPGGGSSKDFLGFPIPSAAGLVSSLTLLILRLNENEKELGNWKYLLVVVLLFLSAMMVSTVRCPTTKKPQRISVGRICVSRSWARCWRRHRRPGSCRPNWKVWPPNHGFIRLRDDRRVLASLRSSAGTTPRAPGRAIR